MEEVRWRWWRWWQWRRVTCTPTPTLSAAEIPYSWGTTYAAIVRAAWYSSGSARRLRWALWITCEWGELRGVNRNCARCEWRLRWALWITSCIALSYRSGSFDVSN